MKKHYKEEIKEN